ncbi:hypothetical protein GALMADRAFT_249753 [Galerina marginata CBS 339.88]|uniref:DUF6533 domain-containing protein n=1 Tax=Galerina marginata (strain CBS 339.88) TaxID=685588 RepID=A0A067SV80_GALM3|nr:hypothetical protein GALMADRAFT_249753 [Galerina marginata CBS 339.88]
MNDGPQIANNPNAPLVAQAVSFVSFAALAAQTWELMVSFTDEVEYMWRGKFTIFKTLYFSARYGMLAAQVINQTLSFYVDGRQQPKSQPSPLCPGIFIYKSIISQIGLALVEIILLLRVYALYNQNHKARRFLMLVFVAATILETTGNGIVIRSLGSVTGCAPAKVDKNGIAIFGLGAGFCQLVILSTTLVKYYGSRQAGWARTPLTSLMLKEGAAAFILIFTLLTILIAYEIVRRIDIQVENAAFSWHIALLSIAASRLVLNMRKVAVTHLNRHTSEDDSMATRTYDSTQDESFRLTSLHESYLE